MICLACKSISGIRRISPGPIIHNGKYWLVEHAYPTKVLGWLVIVAKRHVESLHELSKAEWKELLILQEKLISLVHKTTNSRKEYVLCMSEADGFHHIHFHIIPRRLSLPVKYRGSNIFSLIGEASVPANQAVGKKDIIKYCRKVIKIF